MKLHDWHCYSVLEALGENRPVAVATAPYPMEPAFKWASSDSEVDCDRLQVLQPTFLFDFNGNRQLHLREEIDLSTSRVPLSKPMLAYSLRHKLS